MKKVAFRWIDQYLVNVKIQENFLVLFFAPLLAIIIVSMTLMNAAESQQNRLLLQESETIAALIAKSDLSREEVKLVLQKSNFQIGIQGANTTPVPNANYSLTTAKQPSLISEITGTQAAVVITACVFIILCLYYIMTFMGGAMFDVYMALKRLADGDLASRINYAPARNEFNLLAQTIDQVSEREHRLVKATQEAIALIQSISTELQQRSNDNEQLANQQQDSMDSLLSATQQMVHSIREVASHAQDTSGQTHEATQVSNQGLEQVTNTLSSINQLSTEINSAAEAVTSLDSNAVKINDMVTTINAISEQTNLLALNAAIEAARAGEQGRGFAVVADEVRTLAGRTQSATVEIQQLIEELKNNSQCLLKITQHTVSNAQASEDMMNSVILDIRLISEKNQYIADRSTEIAAAAEEQGVVSDNIATDVELVRTQSLKVADMVTKSASEIQHLNQQTTELEGLMKGLTV